MSYGGGRGGGRGGLSAAYGSAGSSVPPGGRGGINPVVAFQRGNDGINAPSQHILGYERGGVDDRMGGMSSGVPHAGFGSGTVVVSPQSPVFINICVMVDEGTDRGVTEEKATKVRTELISKAMSESYGGEFIAHAIRKRLKSSDLVVVLNTLTLLDELMRTCPYFYRSIANDKFFRRMWRFVNPSYKEGMKGVFKGPKLETTSPEVTERVLILWKAWAETLQKLFAGKYEPAAAFIVERYTTKRMKVRFPEVPHSDIPWVCVPESKTRSRLQAAAEGTMTKDMSFNEIENTITLFHSMLENAVDIREIQTSETMAELSERCEGIRKDLEYCAAGRVTEKDLPRVVQASETLESSLKKFKDALDGKWKPPERLRRVVESSDESDGYYGRGPGPEAGPDYHDDYYDDERDYAPPPVRVPSQGYSSDESPARIKKRSTSKKEKKKPKDEDNTKAKSNKKVLVDVEPDAPKKKKSIKAKKEKEKESTFEIIAGRSSENPMPDMQALALVPVSAPPAGYGVGQYGVVGNAFPGGYVHGMYPTTSSNPGYAVYPAHPQAGYPTVSHPSSTYSTVSAPPSVQSDYSAPGQAYVSQDLNGAAYTTSNSYQSISVASMSGTAYPYVLNPGVRPEFHPQQASHVPPGAPVPQYQDAQRQQQAIQAAANAYYSTLNGTQGPSGFVTMSHPPGGAAAPPPQLVRGSATSGVQIQRLDSTISLPTSTTQSHNPFE